MVKTQGRSKKRKKKENFQEEENDKSRIRNREGWRKWRMESPGCAS